MSRDRSHQRIEELLGTLNINNSRLSLHSEKISQLDIDVLRKQCIDLYEEINKLALQGKVKRATEPKVLTRTDIEVPEPTPDPVASAPVMVPEPAKVSDVKEEVVPQAEIEVAPVVEKKIPKPKADDEMLSLFEKFSSEPIETISKGMSIAKRFEFQSAFFDGDTVEYKNFIQQIDEAGDRDAAFHIYHSYKNKLKWDNEELKDELKALMYRKYH